MTEIRDRLSGRLSAEGRLDWRPYLYLLPAFLMIAVFMAYPLVDTFLLSFQEVVTLGGETNWVGLDNYVAVLTDPLFWVAAMRSSLAKNPVAVC